MNIDTGKGKLCKYHDGGIDYFLIHKLSREPHFKQEWMILVQCEERQKKTSVDSLIREIVSKFKACFLSVSTVFFVYRIFMSIVEQRNQCFLKKPDVKQLIENADFFN